MSVIRAENLVKQYKGRMVVDQASLSVSQGQVVGLLGPNGAGKTTSFYMVVGLVRADSGKILLDEEDITRDKVHVRARKAIGYLPQEASVFRGLSVEDNIFAILEINKNLNKKQKRQRLEQLLEDFQIGHIRKSKGISLSGGERRRVEIARCLAIEPKFILLDEPFAGVDPISVQEIQKIIRILAEQNVGILITDHNVRETLHVCDYSYILSAGKIIAEGGSESILANAEVRSVYLGEGFQV
jgi:lipopolysaccharide export system ATP-binding protein